MAALNGRVVCGNLDGSGATGSEIQHAGCLVGTGTHDLGSILEIEKNRRQYLGTTRRRGLKRDLNLPETSSSSEQELRARRAPFLHFVPGR